MNKLFLLFFAVMAAVVGPTAFSVQTIPLTFPATFTNTDPSSLSPHEGHLRADVTFEVNAREGLVVKSIVYFVSHSKEKPSLKIDGSRRDLLDSFVKEYLFFSIRQVALVLQLKDKFTELHLPAPGINFSQIELILNFGNELQHPGDPTSQAVPVLYGLRQLLIREGSDHRISDVEGEVFRVDAANRTADPSLTTRFESWRATYRTAKLNPWLTLETHLLTLSPETALAVHTFMERERLQYTLLSREIESRYVPRIIQAFQPAKASPKLPRGCLVAIGVGATGGVSSLIYWLLQWIAH